jgi:hypothetical protein
MKNRLVRTAFAVAIAASVSACGPDNQNPTTATLPTTPETQPTSAPPEFKGMTAQLPAAGNCALDVLNGVPVSNVLTVKKTDSISLGGWMANSSGKVPMDAKLVLHSATKSYGIPVSGGGTREDVAQVMHSDELRTSGFELPLNLAGAQAGSYDLAIVMDADAHACPLNIKLIIVD